MQLQNNCVNCQRLFQQGQIFPPEGIHFQFKNYRFPIQDYQLKFTLLKVVVSFLNSKGGTLFMGIDDSSRSALGLKVDLKDQDSFMLQFWQLLSNINPQIDLNVQQHVKIKFVPVFKDKTFIGKYVIKIIVKQGDPSKVYRFTEPLKLSYKDKKSRDGPTYAFYRSNMGKVDTIKGNQLLQKIEQKAKNPSKICQTFHPGCNPQPLQVMNDNLNIGFRSLIKPEFKYKILEFVQKRLKQIKLDTLYNIEISSQKDQMMIKFKSISDYKKANDYLIKNLQKIQQILGQNFILLDDGHVDKTHYYKIGEKSKRSYKQKKQFPKERAQKMDVQQPEQKKYKNTIDNNSFKSQKSYRQKQHHISKDKNSQIKNNADKDINTLNNKLNHQEFNKQSNNKPNQSLKSFPFVLTNLRINLSEQQRTRLIKLLKNVIKNNFGQDSKIKILNQKNFSRIIEINFDSQNNRKLFSNLMNKQKLKQKGFVDYFTNLKVYWGEVSGEIKIKNYNEDKRYFLKEQLDNLFPQKGELKCLQSKYQKQMDKYYLKMVFKPDDLVQAYDKILIRVNKNNIKELALSKQGIHVIPLLDKA